MNNYYPEPGEDNLPYGGCGIHDYINRHEWDYCPECLTEDMKYDTNRQLLEDEYLARLREEEY